MVKREVAIEATPEQRVADAVRAVAVRLQKALDQGRRSSRIDAQDVLDLLLQVAEELDRE